MTVFLLRHGNADATAATDRERALTEIGRREIRGVLSACVDDLKSVQSIWVSPYRRALETCAVAREYLPDVEVRQCDFLTPNSSPSRVMAELQSSGLKSLILIAHQPLLGTLLDDLCDFEPGQYRLGTGSCAAVVVGDLFESGLGELKWLRHA